MKKRAMPNKKIERDYQAKRAEREGPDRVGTFAIVVGAPAGSVTDGSTTTSGSFANGGHTYATRLHPAGLPTV
jgi:hypothetical protein